MPRLLPGTLLLEGVSGVVEEVPGVEEHEGEPGLQPGREPGSGGPRMSAADFRDLPRKSAADIRDLPRVRGRASKPAAGLQSSSSGHNRTQPNWSTGTLAIAIAPSAATLEPCATAADVESTVPLPRTPCLIVQGDMMKPTAWMLSIEQKVVVGPHHSFSNGIAAIFESYYCFNLQYPEECSSTLAFIQRCFLSNNPEKGSKAKKKRGLVNPHVSILLRKIFDFEWISMYCEMCRDVSVTRETVFTSLLDTRLIKVVFSKDSSLGGGFKSLRVQACVCCCHVNYTVFLCKHGLILCYIPNYTYK
ncbi:unnamed protein product [Arctogadus glacialis]